MSNALAAFRSWMPRHRLTTTKILAVALVATPACGKPDTAPPTPEPQTSAASARKGQPDDPMLVALRTELDGMSRKDALSRLPHFRPLCDEAGFPLVGNVARKVPEPTLLPSEVCAEVRKAGH